MKTDLAKPITVKLICLVILKMLELLAQHAKPIIVFNRAAENPFKQEESIL
jgi:hypothetical protein